MAEQLALVRTCDFAAAGISTANLLDSSGIEIAAGGWQPQVIPYGENEVAEAMTLVVNGTSIDSAATKVQAIYQKVRECEWSKQSEERYQVYLVDQLSGETNARQAVVKSMEFTPGASLHDYYPVRNSNSWNGAQLGLVRGHWEDTTYTNTTIPFFSRGADGALTPDIPGDIPARIASLSFTANAAVTEMWWGFKTSRNVSVIPWFGLWEMEKGTPGTDAGTAADAGASGVNVMRCNFATGTAMLTRMTLTPYQLDSTNYSELRGKYKLLARMKVDSGYTCRVRSAYGLTAGTANLVYNEPVTVSNTSWYVYDLGNISLPGGGAGNYTNGGSASMQNSIIALQVQLYSGAQGATTYWYGDYFDAVPIDEGYGHVKNGAGSSSIIYSDALGRISAYSNDYTEIPDTTGTDPDNFTIPVGGSLSVYLFSAAQRAASSVLADEGTITINFIPRWFSLRGTP